MPLTDSAVLEELVHALSAHEDNLPPRALATLLLAEERLGFEVSNYTIHILKFGCVGPGSVKVVTVPEYGQMLEQALIKKGGYEVLHVVRRM